MNKDEMPLYAKELIRRAIANKLKIRRDHLIASPEAQAAVERCLTTVKAIADSQTLDGAIDDLLKIHLEGGDVVSRRDIQRETEACCSTFNVEITGIKRMCEMNRMNLQPKEMWDFLRCRVPVGTEYEDDWLQTADAWILRGETRLLPLGTASIFFFTDDSDSNS